MPGSGNAYTEIVVDTFPQPAGIAVSSTGVLYVGDPTNRHVIAETHVGSGGFTHTSLFTNVYAIGVAVDGNGNVYVLDPNAHTVVKETYSSSGFAQSTIYTSPAVIYDQGIHADAVGNVYIARALLNSVTKLSVDSTGNYSASTIFNAGLNNPLDAAVDSTGKLFIADYLNNRVLMVNFSGASFGSIPIATASTSQSLTFIFDTGGTLASTPYSVLTQGAPNLDFNAASTQPSSVCVTGHSYNAGDTCTVDVIFTPRLSGIRYGAATLSNSAGGVNSTAYIYGTGTGPQVAFSPGAQSTLGSGFSYPFGVAVDGSGNVYVADSTNNAVKEIVAVGGSIPASPTINVPTVGSHTYGAQYAGDANFSASPLTSATSAVLVGKAASTLTPSLTSQTLMYNTGGTISINVTGQFAGTGIAQPTGSITYTIGSGTLQTAPITSNAATVTIPASLAAGTYSIAVNYAGDGNYNAATQVTINLAIKQVTPAVTWPTPAAITYGTPLSSTQLSATANVAGTFIYTPPTGTVLAAGPQTLDVTFTPTDTTDYTAARRDDVRSPMRCRTGPRRVEHQVE